MTFRTNETVFCRFTGEAFTVIDCNGCVATLRDSTGNITSRVVGEITRVGG
jgi:ribosomal protein S27E